MVAIATRPNHIASSTAPDVDPSRRRRRIETGFDDDASQGLHMESVRDLLDAHDVAPFPTELSAGDEASGVALAMLDADIAGLAASYLQHDGALPEEQWRALLECAAVMRVIVPGLTGEAWVYFARLFALSQAMLRTAPDIPREEE